MARAASSMNEASSAPGTGAGGPLALALAQRVLGFQEADLTPAAASAARTAIIDTLGVTLLGSVEESVHMVRSVLGETTSGPAHVAGTGERVSVLDAALVNGVASHALDFDDFTQDFGGHPSVPIVPGLFALAEARGASGKAFVTAYVAGVELETRFAHGVNFHHYEKGWHPTSTLGVFGAASAAAHLLGLDTTRTATALAIAASLASGIKANFGTPTKPLHVGHCARGGVMAALLAEQGFEASIDDVFEHPQGFLRVYNGEGHFNVDAMLVPWFQPPLVCDPGISLKQFACCGSTHPAIYMALALRRKHGPGVDDVRRMSILTHPRRLPHTDNPDPQTALEAKFSIQYCAARALLDGEPRLAHFEEGAIMDEPVRRLMAVVQAGAHPEMNRADQAFGAEVILELVDGRTVSERVPHMPGRGPLHPMSEDELKAKFMDCAVRAMDESRADFLFERLCTLEEVADMREIGPLLGRA